MQATNNSSTILAFDVGEKRIGVARAHLGTPFPGPLTTLTNPDTFVDDIVALCQHEEAACVVLGLPRGLGGQETGQTAAVREFGEQLQGRLEAIGVPLYWNDEAVTSMKAEDELKRRGKPYSKGDIDALAATYILEDFIGSHPRILTGEKSDEL